MRNFWHQCKSFISQLWKRKSREVKIVLDQENLRAISQTVGKQLAKACTRQRAALNKALIRLLLAELKKELPKALGVKPRGKPSEIKIKESFINPIEAGDKLRPRFSREPPRKKTSGADIEESLKTLKKSQWQSKKLRLG